MSDQNVPVDPEVAAAATDHGVVDPAPPSPPDDYFVDYEEGEGPEETGDASVPAELLELHLELEEQGLSPEDLSPFKEG